MNVDLHCHSSVSDGTLAPAAVAARARAHGVEIWSLTDHDEVGGQAEAAGAAADLGMRFIPGVEISVTWAGHTVHIVGVGIDPADETLVRGLAATRNGRADRARRMAASLARVGIEGAFEGALHYVGNPDLISRTHFARFLVERGVCRNVSDVFERYLSEGKPGYEPMQWATLTNAIAWIRGAGGIAVLAHPGRYDLDDLGLSALIDDFRGLGGRGIEVITGSHTPDEYVKFAGIARATGLLASRGSDFHSPDESNVELGELPDLPADLTPVWSELLARPAMSAA